jgi:acyl transferase domain-containing protein
MTMTSQRAIAIVGVGAVLPDAPDAPTFWDNLTAGRYSISEVDPVRWDPALYFDADHSAPDKTYSTIGGWVHDFAWAPLEWRLPIPPKVSDAMDRTQQWAVAAAREALTDYGYPDRPLDTDRTAVVIGNAMGGDKHYLTALRAFFPEYADELGRSATFADLPGDTRAAILDELRTGVRARFPEITEDTMPGELANIIAGRIANLFNLHGANFVVDAACASAMAAIDAAVEGLEDGDFDAVITGGVDANMSASTFIKFCKIGALSATGTRPYGDGADGFVMGEGAALFVLKRLADAEADGDRIYAVSAGRATARARASPRPTPSGNAWRSSAPGATPVSPRTSPPTSRGTAPRRRSVTWSSTAASSTPSVVSTSRSAPSRSDRSSRTSGTSRVRPERRACSRPRWRSTTRRCRPRSTPNDPIPTSISHPHRSPSTRNCASGTPTATCGRRA